MRVRKEVMNKMGKREVTVELEPDEKLIMFDDRSYYRLGGQVDMVVRGHVITESDHVYWCSVGQEWSR